MKTALDEWVSLYKLDVSEYQHSYKASVVEDPEKAARNIVEGLEEAGIRQLIRDLKAERRSLGGGIGR